MISIHFIFIVLCCGCLALIFFQDGQDLQWSLPQEEVWNQEKLYWIYFKEGNIEQLATFWHENFIGWPMHASKPSNMSESKDSLAEFLKMVKILNYELEPQAIAVEGNIGILHYSAKLELEYPDGRTITDLFRASHIWMNEKNQWKLISGMSAGFDKF